MSKAHCDTVRTSTVEVQNLYEIIETKQEEKEQTLTSAGQEDTDSTGEDCIYETMTCSELLKHKKEESFDSTLTLENNLYNCVAKADEVSSREEEISCYEATAVNKNDAAVCLDRNDHTKQAKNTNSKPILCAVICIVSVIALSLICVTAVFADISKLKSEIRSKQNLMNNNCSNYEDALTQQVSLLREEIESIQSNQTQLLVQNTSLDLSMIDFQISVLQSQIEMLTIGLGRSGQYSTYPASSCAALPPSFPSGYYWVRNTIGSAVRVYCDVTRSCGGVTGGWMRAAELDMTNSSQQCPSGLRQHTDGGIRTCVADSPGCSPIMLPTNNLNYSQVCGRIIAYQFGAPNAFEGTSIDSAYVDGVSLTHGSPRQHIWTFVAALDESGNSPAYNYCPCIKNTEAIRSISSPSFVGEDYFCDTGSQQHVNGQFLFYSANPLWDGAGCGSGNSCCNFNSPPWFYKQLPQPTTDDIEMRVCRDEGASNEDITIEIFEIYIQ